MVENLDKIIERGEKIEVIMDRAVQLKTTSSLYKKHVSKINGLISY
jgi:hypothetical protein